MWTMQTGSWLKSSLIRFTTIDDNANTISFGAKSNLLYQFSKFGFEAIIFIYVVENVMLQ